VWVVFGQSRMDVHVWFKTAQVFLLVTAENIGRDTYFNVTYFKGYKLPICPMLGLRCLISIDPCLCKQTI